MSWSSATVSQVRAVTEGATMACCDNPDPEKLFPNYSRYPEDPESGYETHSVRIAKPF